MTQHDRYESLDYLNNDLEYANHLLMNVLSIATNKDYDSRNYNEVRSMFLNNSDTKKLVPSFIRTCTDIQKFWTYIKTEYNGTGCHDLRREHIKTSFESLISFLEKKELGCGAAIIEMSTVEETLTIDQELNKLVEEAKERFKNPADKKIALEKLWDAFERIKTYFGTNKRLSSEQLVDLISTDFDKDFINNEFKELTSIGNNYNIRHHEQGKIIISEDKHIEYLFFRMLALLNLCVENIHEKELI